jgi:hypothetical protein
VLVATPDNNQKENAMASTTGRWWRLFAAMLTGALVVAPATAKGPPPPATDWTRHENLAPVIGADGRQHAATCSGLPGTDAGFSFWAKRGSAKDLVIFFEGGGACWDGLTCSFPLGSGLPPPAPEFYAPAINPAADPRYFDGIFALDNSANPVRDWSFVYIPYFTGDLHIVSASRQYFNAGNPLLPPVYAIEHRGFDNIMVVLDWIRKNFDKPKNILVAGSSAGGYGASANFPWIQETFPQARMHVIADASQGVTTPAFDASDPGRNSWHPVLAPWVYGSDPSLLASSDLLRRSAEAYRRARVGQVTTTFDPVQIVFYEVMKQFYGPGGSCPNPAIDWNQQMLATLDSYADEVPNFRYFLAGGTGHTIMSSPQFYAEAPAMPSFAEWVGAMLKDSGGGAGRMQWKDTACPTCLLAPPCS